MTWRDLESHVTALRHLIVEQDGVRSLTLVPSRSVIAVGSAHNMPYSLVSSTGQRAPLTRGRAKPPHHFKPTIYFWQAHLFWGTLAGSAVKIDFLKSLWLGPADFTKFFEASYWI